MATKPQAAKSQDYHKSFDYENGVPEQFVGGFEIEKVVREHVGVKAGGFGTFGSALNAQLEEAALARQEVRSITLEINSDYWSDFAERVQRSGEPV